MASRAGPLNDLKALAENCRLCPHACGARRAEGEVGFCGVGDAPLLASYGPHFGEEPELVGRGGSGTIFFGGCNLACVFCQNAELSHGREGRPTNAAELADVMLALQRTGCENVNLVTPTPVADAAAEAAALARGRGLNVPVVYNCGGYESVATLKLLERVVDIYMPDAKYGPAAAAEELSGAPDYFERMAAGLREMHRQVGELTVDARGVATRGLLVRHLVLPDDRADSEGVLRFIVKEISPDTYVNIMDQYRPCHRATEIPALSRRATPEEVSRVRRLARDLGLRRGF